MTGTEEEGARRDTPDPLDELARQYLDLWQDQLTALSANPAVSEAISDFFARWAQAAATAVPGEPGAAPATPAGNAAGKTQDEFGSDRSQPEDVAAPLRPASVDGDDRFGELLERLERIEKRLARLERS